MLDFFDWFTGFSIGICCAFLIFLTINKFLTLRWDRIYVKIPLIWAISYASNVVIFPEELTGTMSYLVSLILILLVFYKDSWYKSLSAAILIFPLTTAVNYVTQDMGFQIWLHIFHRNMQPAAETVLHSLTLFLRIPVWYFIYRCVRNWIPQTARLLTAVMWLILDMISLSSLTGIIFLIYVCNMENSYLAYPACAACIITSLGCCYLCTYMAKNVKADMELQTFQYQQSYYKELEQNQQTVRRLRHDMKNHLNIIGTLLKERKLDEAEEYFSELNQEFVSNIRSYCPNSIVNAVLNSKYQAAKEAGIPCRFMVDLKETPAIEDLDLCSLIGNTLDNAIEACEKISDPAERSITLKTRCQKGYFSYEIQNTKSNDITIKNGVFLTAKKEKESHGIGLKNVRNIVEKYSGDLDIAYENGFFSLTVLISPH